MGDDLAVSVNNITKTYRLYESHADRVKEAFHPFRKKYHRTFHALKDITFAVEKGETVGIIGRNGSGKSTLLQIICGILQPTSGNVEVEGRLSALLELGAGFNPEYSGYQNVYINGSIMGLTRKEIDAHIEDIKAFADIGDFINQPVKSYSSGMVVRLAFAVAVSIEPDILIVDEALAVGDEAFQRKCFSHIHQIQDRGGTILFVSHSADSIIELCNRALLLDGGELILGGSPKEVISRYHKMIFAPPARIEKMKSEWETEPNRLNLVSQEPIDETDGKGSQTIQNERDSKKDNTPPQQSFYSPGLVPQSTIYYERRGAIISDARIVTQAGRQANILVNRGDYIYTYKVFFEHEAYQVRFGMLIKTVSGLEIGGGVTAPAGEGIDNIEAGTHWVVEFHFRCSLNPGTYFLNAGVLGVVGGSEIYLDRNIDIAMFSIQEQERIVSTAITDLIVGSNARMVEEHQQKEPVSATNMVSSGAMEN